MQTIVTAAEPTAIRPAPVRRRTSWFARLTLTGAEALSGVVVALAFTWLSMRIHVNPMTRIGQVSGLAALQLRFLLAFVVIASLLWTLSRWGARTPALRVACGSLAGLATGLYAGGIAVALRGTAWPLNGDGGDAGQVQTWAMGLLQGKPISSVYPPIFPHLMAWWTEHLNPGRPGAALKILTLLIVALAGPAAYLAWRLVLPPLWALGVGVVASYPILNAVKPYADVVLIVLVPLLARLLTGMLNASRLSAPKAILQGLLFGLGLSGLFLLYSGWFVWSAPGVFACLALTLVKTWREGWPVMGRALLLLATTGAVFLVVSGSYLLRLLAGSGTPDTYMYFDTGVDPAYFLMWQGDMPGAVGSGPWPVPGELAGVGAFAVLLLAGLVTALWLGSDQPAVQLAAFSVLGAFGLRYWFASHMERDGAVQLYPRTSEELLYCLLVLAGLACYLAVRRLGERPRTGRAAERLAGVPGLRVSGAVLCGLALFFSMAGSATVDRFMPADPARNTWGQMAWYAHNLRNPDGSCPTYSLPQVCKR
ncbi:hypothetical protein [Kitasatospora sp. MBT63]|uniref:hypothetical protein n=1 Tax=Kitasatospora sp. MBT63 TaxID=1444768 RepID=UPI00053A53A3|nr:hypothetical protein [Kitasatospora sp. MBT63]